MKEITDWELLRAGTHTAENGKSYTFTNEMIDTIAANVNKNAGSDPHNMPAKLGFAKVGDHEFFDIDKLPAAGWTRSAVSRESSPGVKSLYGNVADIPEGIYQLIKENALPNVSPEIALDYKGEGPTMLNFSILGARRPAIKGMSHPLAFKDRSALLGAFGVSEENAEAISHLFCDDMGETIKLSLGQGDDIEPTADITKKQKGRVKMSDKIYTQEQLDSMTEVAVKKAEKLVSAKFTEAQTAAEQKAIKLQEDIDSKKAELAKLAEADKTARTKAVLDFAEKLKTEQHVAPALIDDCKLAELISSLPGDNVVKFSEGGKEVEGSTQARVMSLLTSTLKLAEESKLFVPQKEQMIVNKDGVIQDKGSSAKFTETRAQEILTAGNYGKIKTNEGGASK